MSKEDTCKVSSATKHKERKPKKPHYIPRPWGKPYNYKCFQCPFTCMEKSHLYNHMKYSLCKNSLSLLIESDWPYKKGNILHPDQLRVTKESPSSNKGEAATETSSHTKAKAEPRVSSSIPCYPPPPNLVDYQDPTGLNLSVLGVGYPISPSLFSYMNSVIPTAATSVAAQSQIAQLPFLASAAQLMHPASSTHSPSERALISPRLYYPFLCEHTFGQSEPSKALKTSTNNLEGNVLSSFQPKVNLWKVPAVRPGSAAVQTMGWVSPQRDSPEQTFRAQGEKHLEAPAEKKPSMGFTFDLLKNIQTASSLNLPLESWYKEAVSSQNSDTSTHSTAIGLNTQDSSRSASGESSESVAALLTDLSKALRDYQEAERKISHMEAEDLPAQRHLWEHLSKIRSELSHIHQALEQTSRPSDGPLDLSVKREKDEADDESERKALNASLESRKQSLDILIKLGQTGSTVVNADILTAGALALRPSPNEALWPGRTTKCEADSSVLLCPDGRSVVFTDISAKTQKRSPSIQRFEAQCPPSPLTATDN
uniref:Si:ch211-248l17.3 n=1 Tax=Neogobius melanostomus TaxID=47308 RepID=A0A8C6T2Z1_9GOBI